MEKQLLVAQQRAVQIKGDRYGVEFQYEINGKIFKQKTGFGFKTIGDLMSIILKNEIAQNLCPFNSQNDLLGYDMLLAEVKHISIKPVDEQDMIFVHFIVNNTSQSFLFNKKQITVKNAISEYNKDKESALKIDNYKQYEIMGKQINEGNINKFLCEMISGEQGYIKQFVQ
ncbi:unnamed protein product (macronuclear) [Paramecium tetraurelia]|uniref:Uncharacterized protein n=1 Tax=Paramecium tetraurelia TaxID=5888 RepID=A0CLX7_PARTE|nr:uncharacterized protein GSPATT00008273001 [Paramecium tetraurelia]CAK71794.1 unnamed protein product [Paramecium tetraurelia]|eukprot:XP_001439191.1 hypothetical protein (macronuclear) [Paramecium tetraurelia strain d4-2]